MNLYLVQHGEAKPKEEDPERGLTDGGRADVEKAAAYAAAHCGINVNEIVHSGELRARQTAEILAGCLKPPDGMREADALEPLADATIWAERLRRSDGDAMLVGHLPHLSNLASLLLCKDEARNVVAFRNGGVVCLRRGEAGDWALRWMITPDVS